MHTQDSDWTVEYESNQKKTGEVPGNLPVDRRQSVRAHYEATIAWAEYIDDWPSPSGFSDATTVDLSPAGFSFLTNENVTANRLLVTLADLDSASHLLVADVATIEPTSWNGTRLNRVGCSLCEKIENPFRN